MQSSSDTVPLDAATGKSYDAPPNGSGFCCAARLHTSEAYPPALPRQQQFLVRHPALNGLSCAETLPPDRRGGVHQPEWFAHHY